MADTRQFTDHNEIGGVNVYLEDKKLAESPEQNTVATTDYVLLKDTDGVPHKISKANMMSVVKDALADLLKNNDLGTSVTKVPALNASAFGSATVANLASLLGGLKTRDQPSSKDANDIKQTGCYQASGLTNVPVQGGCLLVCIRGAGDYMAQLFFEVTAGGAFYVRTGIDRSGYGWLSWKQITLSALS